MSTPRLILKQPTGWFAAGREFAQAITLLSDGAFNFGAFEKCPGSAFQK